MIIPLAIGAVGLYLLMQGASKGGGTSIAPSDVGADLSKAISDAIVSNNAALKLRTHDAIVQHPKGKEPQMENARQMLANQLMAMEAIPARGPQTQREYRLKLAGLFADGVRMYDVFTSSRSKILRYREELDGRRKFIDAPPGVDPAILRAAFSDFNLGTPES